MPPIQNWVCIHTNLHASVDTDGLARPRMWLTQTTDFNVEQQALGGCIVSFPIHEDSFHNSQTYYLVGNSVPTKPSLMQQKR